MKRFVPLTLLLLILLMFTGCGDSRGREVHSELVHRLEVNEGLSFSSDIRAEFPDRSYSFSLDYRQDGENARIKVTKPELIAGIQATVSPGGSTVEYDGVCLDMGELDDRGLTPVSSLPFLLETMKSGHLDSWWEEDGKTVLMLVADDSRSVTLWLESESLTPMRAELICDGTVVVFCDISDWNYGAPT